ncbi:hypothetical protein FVF58_00910 [Paraburkholderia panacisoli]|uniref:Uncharacterized protein n=1 Tax=Paraburkholderia panacisoli TaxID=2603818 RepID=A0A5B0HKZ1_9BURK|nr:hypothetical protein [Paraburkholderia panacisoli]KAA1015946.1 hypothetical protein FVF58_00910 [Paraburkholderia panacisoli]
MNAGKRRRREPRSTYSYTIEEEFVCIIDHDRGRSVTNDAANVIADLVAAGIDVAKYRIIYRDTAGIWDLMCTAGGTFAGFIHLNARTKEEAKARRCCAPDDAAAQRGPS